MLFEMYDDIFFNKGKICVDDKLKALREIVLNQGNKFIISRHPLGFLCLTIPIRNYEKLRLHFWDRSFNFYQNPYWPVHNHIFDFNSQVLKGVIQNKKYILRSYGRESLKCGKYRVSYDGDKSLLTFEENTYPRVCEVEVIKEGEIYHMDCSDYHRSRCLTNIGVTLMATKDNEKSEVVYTLGNGIDKQLIFDRSSKIENNIYDYFEENL
ncbi:hypothetical protein [Comamonas sp. C24C]